MKKKLVNDCVCLKESPTPTTYMIFRVTTLLKKPEVNSDITRAKEYLIENRKNTISLCQDKMIRCVGFYKSKTFLQDTMSHCMFFFLPLN